MPLQLVRQIHDEQPAAVNLQLNPLQHLGELTTLIVVCCETGPYQTSLDVKLGEGRDAMCPYKGANC